MIARLLLILLIAGPAQAAESFTLDNGLRVVLEPDRRQPWAVVLLCYDAGTRDEGPGEFETAHLFEHLMFRGTAASPGGFSEELRQLGGSENGFTRADRTCYESRVGSADLHRVLWLEADRMHNLGEALDAEDLASQQAVVKAEILQKNVDDPFGLALETLRANLFVDHPYAQSTARRLVDLANADLARLSAWHRQRYVPGSAWLAVVGDFDVAETRAWLGKTLGAVPSVSPLERPRVSRSTGAIKRFARVDPGENRHETILFGWPGPKAATVDADALEVAAELITHRESSLYQALGEEHWYLGSSAFLLQMDHGSVFTLAVSVKAGTYRRQIDAEVRNAVLELIRENPEIEAWKDAQDVIVGQRLVSRGDPMERAYDLLRAWWFAGGVEHVADLQERRDAVDLKALSAAAERWLAPRGVTVVAIAEEAEAADFEKVYP